jgi:antitoxin YefM
VVVPGRPTVQTTDVRPRGSSTEVAIPLAMTTLAEQMPLADVKNRISEVVDRVEREHWRVVITKHGRPAAVVLSVDDLESLEETLDVLGDATLMADIRHALHDLDAAGATVLGKDEALRLTYPSPAARDRRREG